MPKKKLQMPTMAELTEYLNAQSGKTNKRDIAKAFGVRGDDRIVLKHMLKELKESGVMRTDNRTFTMSGALNERSIVEITGQDSMGDLLARPLEWVSSEPMPQITIVKDRLKPPAGIGDIVQAKLTYVGSRLYEGEAIRRVTAGENHMVGVFENGFVSSVDRRLKQAFKVVNLSTEKLQNKDIIIVDIPMIRGRFPEAKFVKKIASMDSPYAATLISIYMHHLPIAFSKAAENAAQKLSVPTIDKEREDLTAIPFVTIDGADARDFDDAVWAEPDSSGWHIMVAIADVCWYVRPAEALDIDARIRGNSVYFPDRVLPMLPVELSNGVCSLQPNQARAAMVCEAWIDKNGKKIKHQFRRALIKSIRRLTYEEVQNALDGKMPVAGLEQEIENLKCAYKALALQRARRGVLEINVPEREVILTKEGRVKDIRLRQIDDSNRLIEEMMILANVAAAETLEEKGMPTMYRVHDRPSVEKIENLNAYLSGLGQKRQVSENASPADFNDILTHAKGTSKETAVNEFVLRAQSQAIYSPENIGHFGLALTKYAHFTSPIRRYADIMVHRALVKALKLGKGALTEEEENTFEETARHISYTERQAASAEQDADDRYIASFLQDKVGGKFSARISSITAFGMFVHLDDYGADGIIPFSSITGDYFEADEGTQSLVGRSTGKTYTAGDMVQVVLTECSPITGGLVFHLISNGKMVRTQSGKDARGTRKSITKKSARKTVKKSTTRKRK